MLYVFHGTDVEMARVKARALIDSLRKKRPDADYEEIGFDNWNAQILESHLGGQGLFSNKYIIFLNRVTENVEALEILGDFIPAMHESTNIFIVLEGKLKADLKKAFTKSAEKVVECELKIFNRAGTHEDFNIFALADALGNREAFKAWFIYRQAIDRGLEAESILGTLFWQAKSMMLAAHAKTAGEAIMNPFVFGKSKRYATKYSAVERQNLLADIVTLYHDGHRGLVDMEKGTECLLLRQGKNVII